MKMAIKAILIIAPALTAVAAYSAPGDSFQVESLQSALFNSSNGDFLYLELYENERNPYDNYYLVGRLGGHDFDCYRLGGTPKLDLLYVNPTAANASFTIALNKLQELGTCHGTPPATISGSCIANGDTAFSEVRNGSAVQYGSKYLYHDNHKENSATCTVAIDPAANLEFQWAIIGHGQVFLQ